MRWELKYVNKIFRTRKLPKCLQAIANKHNAWYAKYVLLKNEEFIGSFI